MKSDLWLLSFGDILPPYIRNNESNQQILTNVVFLFQDEVRTQKATKQKSTLEAVNNSVKLLNEMLAHFNPEDSTDADRELIRVRYLLAKIQMTFLKRLICLSLVDLSGNTNRKFQMFPIQPLSSLR